MTVPVREDGGGLDAASALAFSLVEDEALRLKLGERLRQCIAPETEDRAATRLNVKIAPLRRACQTGHADANLLRKVCGTFGVNGHWLLTGEGEMRARRTPGAEESSHELGEVEEQLAAMRRLIDTAHEGDPRSTLNSYGHDWL